MFSLPSNHLGGGDGKVGSLEKLRPMLRCIDGLIPKSYLSIFLSWSQSLPRLSHM